MITPSYIFNPYAVGSPSVLHDGDELRHFGSGNGIDKWTDLTGNGHNVAQAVGVSQPLALITNGHWGANLDGVNDSWDAANSWTATGGWACFIVHQTSGDCILIANQGTFAQMRIGRLGVDILSIYDDVAEPMSTTLWQPRTEIQVIAYGRQSGSNNALFYQSGRIFSASTTSNAPTWNRMGTALGGGGSWTTGNIYYHLYYPFGLTDGQFDYVIRGLCRKYGAAYISN